LIHYFPSVTNKKEYNLFIWQTYNFFKPAPTVFLVDKLFKALVWQTFVGIITVDIDDKHSVALSVQKVNNFIVRPCMALVICAIDHCRLRCKGQSRSVGSLMALVANPAFRLEVSRHLRH
jgi:hypothetical protein